MNELVSVAKIARPRGLKGELVADLTTDFPERFEGLSRVTAILADSKHRVLQIEDHWFQNGRIVFKFAGIDRIEDADPLRDALICVEENEAVDLDSDEYFDWQLEGCSVVNIDGQTIGVVKEVMRTGGTENLVVDGAKEYLIPFAESICVEVDIDNKLIKIDPPDGLLEF